MKESNPEIGKKSLVYGAVLGTIPLDIGCIWLKSVNLYDEITQLAIHESS